MPPTKTAASDWNERIDVPTTLQRPMGAVFAGVAFICLLVLSIVIADWVAALDRGATVNFLNAAPAVVVLVVACVIFARIGFRLLTRQENRVGRASGWSLVSGRPLIIRSLGLSMGIVLAAHFLTGLAFDFAIGGLVASGLRSLVVRSGLETAEVPPINKFTVIHSRLWRGRKQARS